MRRRAFLAGFIAASMPLAAPAYLAASGAQPISSKLTAAIARRYRVAQEAVERVADIAARHFPSDPAVLLAVVGVESSWRPWALGSVGEVGLCQVRPELHGTSAAHLLDPEANIETAARVLRGCLARSGGDLAGALRRYNGAGPPAERYALKVMAEYRRLLAAQEPKRARAKKSPAEKRPAPKNPAAAARDL